MRAAVVLSSMALACASSVCKNEGQYVSGATVAALGNTACSMLSPVAGAETYDATACKETVKLGETSMARTNLLGMMGPCCSDGKLQCEDHLAKVCKEVEFDGSVMLGTGDDETTCGVTRALVSPFQAGETTCHAMASLGPSTTLVRAQLLEYMKPCCGGASTVCDEFAAKVCMGDNFNGQLVLDQQEKTTCAMAVSLLAPFQANKESCGAIVSLGDNNMPRHQALAYMSSCCGGDGTVCDEFREEGMGAQLCKVQTDFKPDATFDESMMKCSVAGSMMPKFVPSPTKCQESVTLGGETKTYKAFMDDVATCCGSSDHACKDMNVDGTTNPAVDVDAARGLATGAALLGPALLLAAGARP